MMSVTERIRQSLLALHMARALETLDHTLGRLEKGEISAIEAIDDLLAEELNLREGRRIGVALRTARLMPVKTIESFDSPSSLRSTGIASPRWPSSSSSIGPRCCIFLGRPAPGNPIWPQPSA